MCTELSPDEIRIDEVALPDVRSALTALAAVTFDHRLCERGADPQRRSGLNAPFAAISRHGVATHDGQAGEVR